MSSLSLVSVLQDGTPLTSKLLHAFPELSQQIAHTLARIEERGFQEPLILLVHRLSGRNLQELSSVLGITTDQVVDRLNSLCTTVNCANTADPNRHSRGL